MRRYILASEIFSYLKKHEKESGGEIQLIDAIQKPNTFQRFFAYDFEGISYDVGEKLGFIQTTIEFALQNEELREDLLNYLQQTLDKSLLKNR